MNIRDLGFDDIEQFRGRAFNLGHLFTKEELDVLVKNPYWKIRISLCMDNIPLEKSHVEMLSKDNYSKVIVDLINNHPEKLTKEIVDRLILQDDRSILHALAKSTKINFTENQLNQVSIREDGQLKDLFIDQRRQMIAKNISCDDAIESKPRKQSL